MSKKRRVAVVIHESWFLSFNALTNEDAGILIKAIGNHIKGRCEPSDLPPPLDAIACDMFEEIDAEREKYNEVCDRRKAAAIKREHDRAQTCTNEHNCAQVEGNNNNNYKYNNNIQIQDKSKDLSREENIKEEKRKRFTPPTLEEVKAYIIEKNLNISAEKFVSYYESNGWRVGKNPMKDWKAACRSWNTRDDRTPASAPAQSHDIFKQALQEIRQEAGL